MKHITPVIITICFYCLLCGEKNTVKFPEKENFHLFLLAGQSNMAGRGMIEEEDKVPHKRVLTLDKYGKWVHAVDPIHFDKPKIAGAGLGKTFGKILAENNPEITVGLIPCAVGGSPISVWEPRQYYEPTKSYPYDDALRRIQTAMKYGVIKGILWHQGESDSKPGNAEVYGEKLYMLIQRFRKELNAPELPFIAGQLGHSSEKSANPSKDIINRFFEDLPQNVKYTGFVSSEGFMFNKDNVHFDSKSLREFGRRYAEVYLKIVE
ncbi:sialate O-acetylesterase [candidate division KSB1 bacterium]